MQLQLINGQFSTKEVTELLSKLIQVKIDYHEQKIKNSDSEEDIKFREHKIKSLQNHFQSFREAIKDKSFISLDGHINLK
ncbi:MAG: hypothetical protein RL377_685 [Bacteroidota bacterium]|jgi:hypothetical protein